MANIDETLDLSGLCEISKRTKAIPKYFVYRGWCYIRITNGLCNYAKGDPVYIKHKSSGELIGYAISDYTWRNDYIVVTLPLEPNHGS